MPKTLIEELPRIAAEGRRKAQQALDRLSSGVQIGLQTNELVLPARDTSGLWRGQNTHQDLYQPWYNRLVLMRELLSERGSIYVHIDWHVGHYMKVILDDIFGKNNFINDIVWQYFMGGKGKREFAKKHDIILFYKKTDEYTFNPFQG